MLHRQTAASCCSCGCSCRGFSQHCTAGSLQACQAACWPLLLGGVGGGLPTAHPRRQPACAAACAAAVQPLQDAQASAAARVAAAAALAHIPAEQGEQGELEQGEAAGAGAAELPAGALEERQEVGSQQQARLHKGEGAAGWDRGWQTVCRAGELRAARWGGRSDGGGGEAAAAEPTTTPFGARQCSAHRIIPLPTVCCVAPTLAEVRVWRYRAKLTSWVSHKQHLRAATPVSLQASAACRPAWNTASSCGWNRMPAWLGLCGAQNGSHCCQEGWWPVLRARAQKGVLRQVHGRPAA